MPTSDLARDKEAIKAAGIFMMGGLASGLIQRAWHPFETCPGFPYFFLWCGVCTLAGLGASFAISRRLRWINTKISFGRVCISAVLVILATLCAVVWGVLLTFVTGALRDPPSISAGKAIPPAHPAFYYGLPIVVGLVSGLAMAAIFVVLTLLALSQSLDRLALRGIIFFSFILVIATLVLHPQLLRVEQLAQQGVGGDPILFQTLASLAIWGNCGYGGCVGYGLARSSGSRAGK